MMRSTCILALAGFAIQSCHALADGSIYFLNTRSSAPQKSRTQSVSPQAARLLLAQKLGVAQFHDLADIDASTVSLLNAHGSYDETLFGAEVGQDRSKHLYIIEGVKQATGW